MVEGLGLRERKKVATWRSIRAAAVKLFLDRGYDAVSVDDIAAAAEVSPSTFFNYFANKEAVVFDPDPADDSALTRLLAGRPPGEALWASLREVLLGYLFAVGERVTVQKRLENTSPRLVESGRVLGDRVGVRLRPWSIGRDPAMSELEASLLVNVALAAVLTAYAAWRPEDGLARFAEMVRGCLDQAGAGLNRPRPS